MDYTLHVRASTEWARDMPDTVGLYLFRCDETNGEPDPVAITRRAGHLTVHDEHLGKTLLTSFHDGLSNPEWLRVA